MAQKGKFKYVFGKCSVCGTKNFPLTKYKGDWYCDPCLKIEKRVPLAIKKLKQENEYKVRWANLTAKQ